MIKGNNCKQTPVAITDICCLQTTHCGCSVMETFTRQEVGFNDHGVSDTADDRQYNHKEAIWLT